jgi:hypothetical protein
MGGTVTVDAHGYALTGSNPEAVEQYQSAIRAFTLGCGNLLGDFDAALVTAPRFVMAHLGKAWIFALATDPGATGLARTIIAGARDLAMDAREASHLASLDHVIAGSPSAAARLLDRHLMHYPYDLLAHVAGFLLDLFLGDTRNLRDRPARALPLWSRDMPGHAAMLGFHALGLEENGAYERAENQARQVAELEPFSFWAHHAVAHVMEMQGRPEDGLGWMLAREALWSTPDHATQTHIWWHRALFHIEFEQNDAALSLYDGPLLATQRPLGEGLISFHRRDYTTAAQMLHAARPAARLIGGSHALRDIVDWTLTEAALRGRQRDMAVALAYERLALRPRSAVNRAFLRRAEGIAR